MKQYTFKMKGGHVFSGIIEKGKYGNGRTALKLVDPEEGPITMITVNLPDYDIGEGVAFIKNYSENEGIMEQMIKQGVIGPPILEVPSGFVSIPLCPVLI